MKKYLIPLTIGDSVVENNKGGSYQGIICERYWLEVLYFKVRRHVKDFGELECPVNHVWYRKSRPSKIAHILVISLKNLGNIVYFNSFVVIELSKSSTFQCKKVPKEYHCQDFELYENALIGVEILIGAEIIKNLLKNPYI